MLANQILLLMALMHKINCYSSIKTKFKQSLSLIEHKLYKKGRSFWLLPFFVFAFSCVNQDLSKSGRISFHNTGGKGSFIFTVSEEFVEDNKNSAQDKYNPKISEAEAALLTKLLKQSKYCLNSKNPPFIITSKQEKIFDMTFAHLIEENYNARPIVPRTYFGQCKTK